MNWASIALLVIFFGYTGLSWSILGPLDSISQSWYLWKERNYSAAFNIFGFLAFLACAGQFYYVKELLTAPLFVLSGAAMWLLTVGSPYKTYNRAHIIPTLASIVLGFAAVFAEFGWSPRFYHPLWMAFVLIMALKTFKVPYSTTFAELILVVAILFNFRLQHGAI